MLSEYNEASLYQAEFQATVLSIIRRACIKLSFQATVLSHGHGHHGHGHGVEFHEASLCL